MKRLFILSAIGTAMLMVVLPSWASINLNSSRSNVYIVVYPGGPGGLLGSDQAKAMGEQLDKLGPSDEATLKHWLAANFKKFGIDATRVKKISIFWEQQISCTASVASCQGRWIGPSLNARVAANAACFCYGPIASPTQVAKVNKASPIRILLLTELDQEAAALAVSDPGKQGIKGTKDVP